MKRFTAYIIYCLVAILASQSVWADNTMIASFITTKKGQSAKITVLSAKDNDALLIDWNGTGVTDRYELPEANTAYSFSNTTSKNGTIRVYSVDNEPQITFFGLEETYIKDVDLSGLKNATGLRFTNCDLNNSTTITWPSNAANMTELYLERNGFTSFDFSNFGSLKNVILNKNKLTSVDLTALPNLETANFSGNQITYISINNPELWDLDLGNNKLTNIDLTQMPKMYQMTLSNNQFTSLDLDAIYGMEWLRVLQIEGNMLDFSTIPVPQANWTVYIYGNQAKLNVAVQNNAVDLSRMYKIDGTETAYAWFTSTPNFDSGTGLFSGDALVEGVDYTIEGGVTTFLRDIPQVVGGFTNALFTNPNRPNTHLLTNPFVVTVVSGGDDPDDPGTGEDPDDPGSGEDPDDPGSGEDPDDPGTGEDPDDPGTGEDPDDPGTGEDPDDPGTGEDPDDPGTGEDPDDPGTGEDPDDPGTGEDPDDPGTGEDPDDPGTGEDPDDPGTGEDPDDPGTGEDPDDPGTGEDPDDPGTGEDPDDPGTGDDPVDSIGSINMDNLQNVKIYNLQGIQVRADRLPPGIYIINGKKFLVK